MSKVNEIERRIRELEAGKFQKLANSYLRRIGYERINALGSVVGSDKTRIGTPDTYIPGSNGKFTFAEHTTVQSGLLGKLRDDLEKCLDEAKTGISTDRLDEVVFCHTGQLEPSEHQELEGLCPAGINLSVFGLHVISTDLAEKYPGIAREHLDIEIDTGQILAPEEFIPTYGKPRFAAPLDTTFRGRESESKNALEVLSAVDVLILTGPAGVGKTRLALEVARRFCEENPEYQTWCLLNRGHNLFVDLQTYFSQPGSFLLVADDANRLSNFEYVVHLLQDRRPDQQFKVIATVRSYALNEVRHKAQAGGSFTEIAVEPFQDTEIGDLLSDEFDITNFLYVDQIKRVAQGNPRLAIMAGRIARATDTLKSIQDVSQLYEIYFTDIKEDLNQLDDPDLLRVAGIVAFFRTVDRTHAAMMAAIESAFGITADTLWEKARILHEYEVFDMYADEIVRTSDQVLATYLFYRAFFVDEVLDFSAVLEHFLPSLRNRLVDSLNPVLQSFDFVRLQAVMTPPVRNRWRILAEASDQSDLLDLIDLFWFLVPTECLIFARDGIRALDQQVVESDDMEITPDEKTRLPAPLRVLSHLRQGDEGAARGAIELILEWAATQPRDAGIALHLLQKGFSFTTDSLYSGYALQRAVLNLIWQRAEEGENSLFSHLFIGVASEYLHTEFEQTESGGWKTVSIRRIRLPHEPALTELRKTTWERLFQIYRTRESFRPHILQIIRKYSQAGYRVSSAAIMGEDAPLLESFILDELEPTRYNHCLLVQSLLDWFEQNGVPYNRDLRARFRNETYDVSELLLDDWAERHGLNLDYAAYRQLKDERLSDFVADLSEEDVLTLIDQCRTIVENLRSADRYQFHGVLERILGLLSRRDSDLFTKVLTRYLTAGEVFEIFPNEVVEILLGTLDPQDALRLLSEPDYPTKSRWLFAYYFHFPEQHVTLQDLSALYELFENAPLEQVPLNLDPLLRFQKIDVRVVPRVVEILLERTEGSLRVRPFELLFNSNSVVATEIGNLFRDDLELLKRAYLASQSTYPNDDYDCRVLSTIVEEDPDFLLEFIDWKLGDEEWSVYREDRPYDFIWRRPDANDLMEKVVHHINDLRRSRNTKGILGTLFKLRQGAVDSDEIKNQQECFFSTMIRKYAHNLEWMQAIFGVVCDLPPERRVAIVEVFLEVNQDVEIFKDLPLEPSHWSFSGSAIPMLHQRIEFWRSLLPSVDSITYLEHKQVIENHIDSLREQIEHERKRDFLEDY